MAVGLSSFRAQRVASWISFKFFVLGTGGTAAAGRRLGCRDGIGRSFLDDALHGIRPRGGAAVVDQDLSIVCKDPLLVVPAGGVVDNLAANGF